MDLIEFARSKKQASIPTNNSVSFHLFSRDLLSCLRFTFFEANTFFRLTLNYCGNFCVYIAEFPFLIVFASVCSFILHFPQAASRLTRPMFLPEKIPRPPSRPSNVPLQLVFTLSHWLFFKALCYLEHSTVFLPTRPVYVPLPHHMFLHWLRFIEISLFYLLVILTWLVIVADFNASDRWVPCDLHWKL